MANKPEYVDLIGEATRQHRRRAAPLRVVARPEVEETSKLSRWRKPSSEATASNKRPALDVNGASYLRT